VIAALFALLLQLLAHLTGPAAASPAHGGTVPPPPAVVAPATRNPSPTPPALSEGDGPAERPDNVPTTCAAGEEWQGEFGCVAVQLPEETIGRADW
jgi:hypothetical protein